MFFKKEPDPVIEFKCHPDLEGVIPEPYPARHYMPDWYKKLAMFVRVEDDGAQTDDPTIKRCPPVLDALVTGWIIPLVCQVEFTIKDKGSSVSCILNKGDNMGKQKDFLVDWLEDIAPYMITACLSIIFYQLITPHLLCNPTSIYYLYLDLHQSKTFQNILLSPLLEEF